MKKRELFSMSLVASTLDVTIEFIGDLLEEKGLIDDSWAVTDKAKDRLLLEEQEFHLSAGDLEWTETEIGITPRGFIFILKEVYYV